MSHNNGVQAQPKFIKNTLAQLITPVTEIPAYMYAKILRHLLLYKLLA